MKLIKSELNSPLGTMLLVTDEQGRARALEFAERRSRLHRNLRSQYGACELVEGPARRMPWPTRCSSTSQVTWMRSTASRWRPPGPISRKERAALRRVRAGRTTTYGAIGKSMGIDDWRAAVDAGAAVGATRPGVGRPRRSRRRAHPSPRLRRGCCPAGDDPRRARG